MEISLILYIDWAVNINRIKVDIVRGTVGKYGFRLGAILKYCKSRIAVFIKAVVFLFAGR